MPLLSIALILSGVIGLNVILGAMSVIVLIIGPVQEALFGVVLAVNTGIGFSQELRASERRTAWPS